MKHTTLRSILLLLGVLAVVLLGSGSGAWAGDEQFFKGLIPGVPLTETEISQVYGKGAVVTFRLDNGSLLNVEGQIDASQTSNQVTDTTGNSGVTSVVPVVGDNNVVTINVSLDVRLNTVEVIDSQGSSINVNQSLDFGGVISTFGK